MFLRPGYDDAGQQLPDLQLLSDAHGKPVLAVTAVNSARRAVLRNAALVSNLVNALPADMRLLVLTNDREAFAARGAESANVQFLPVPADVPITIWPQDPFVVLSGKDGSGELLRSRRFERAGDAHIAALLGEHIGWPVRTSELLFEGGNIVGGERHVFIGADTVRINAVELEVDEAEVVRRFEAELGRPVLVVGPVPQPVGHIDMVLTPIGANRLMLADPGAGAHIARAALQREPDTVAAFEQAVEDAFFGDPRIRTLTLADGTTLSAPDLRGRTEAAVERSEALAPLFDAIASALAAQGYSVLRMPMLSTLPPIDTDGADASERPYRQVLDYPVLTYNNVVLSTGAVAPAVYLPHYGFTDLDAAASEAWRAAGFTVHAVPGFATSALYGGALRCTLKVLARN